MDEGEVPLDHLKIGIAEIWENMCCPLCFSPFTDCVITPCGHSFCSRCIEDWIDRKTICPSCRADVRLNQLAKNYHVESLLQIVTREKDVAQKNYFADLIKQRQGNSRTPPDDGSSSTDPKTPQNTQPILDSKSSPSDKILQRHFESIKIFFDKSVARIDSQHRMAVEHLRNSQAKAASDCNDKYTALMKNKSGGESKSLMVEKAREMEETIAKFDSLLIDREDHHAHLHQHLLGSLDEYMSKVTLAPTFMPLVVTLVVPHRNYRFANIFLRSSDSISGTLNTVLSQRVGDLGEEIDGFTDKNIWALFRVKDGGEISNSPIPLPHAVNATFASYSVENGSEFHLQGELKLKSDAPKQCFSLVYSPGKQDDYYMCKTCKGNWICKNCAEECHKKLGHDVVLAFPNHRPTWACCYCRKKGKCRIPHASRAKGK